MSKNIMDKIKYFIFLSIAMCAVLFASCKEEITAEHTNIFDPESESYTPIAPKGYYYRVYDDSILIYWKDNSLYEDGYIISKRLPLGPSETIDTVFTPINNPTGLYDYIYCDIFRPEPLNNNRNYIYEISAYKSQKKSKPALFYISPASFIPKNFSVVHLSKSSLILRWGYSKGYDFASLLSKNWVIKRKNQILSNTSYDILDTLSISDVSFVDDSLDINVTYCYYLSVLTKYYESERYQVYVTYRNNKWSLL